MQNIVIKREYHQAGANASGKTVFDSLGIATSVICIIHCALMPVLVCLLPVLGRTFAHDDMSHKLLAFWVLSFCLLAIVPGYARHRRPHIVVLMALGLFMVMFATFGHAIGLSEAQEVVLISVGNLIVISTHYLNRKLLLCGSTCNG